MSTPNPNLSMFIRLGINEENIKRYKPLNELTLKYLKQVIMSSSVITFNEGDVVLGKDQDRSMSFYLLKGKLVCKKGLLSKTTIDSKSDQCLYPINKLLVDDVEVKATEAGHILMLDPEFVDTALAWSQAQQAEDAKPVAPIDDATVPASAVLEDGDDWMSGLLQFPLFFNLPPANIQKVFANFQKGGAKKDAMVIRQGAEGDYFYVLIRGTARVVFDNRPGMAPIMLETGSYFGEDALVSEAPRSASVIMNEDGVLGRLDKATFKSLLSDTVVQYMGLEDVGKRLIKKRSHCVLLDVRSQDEFAHDPSSNSRNIPLQNLREAIRDLDTEATYFVTSEGGRRSELAAHLLSQYNLEVYVIRD